MVDLTCLFSSARDMIFSHHIGFNEQLQLLPDALEHVIPEK